MTSTAGQGEATAITAVHREIIQTHILSRLDGATLAAAASASPSLRAICTEEKLWRDLCNSTWTSVNDPVVRDVIDTFPAGHRSFFSDSFPSLYYNRPHPNHRRPSPTSELISAVEIQYQKKPVYSKVQVTETVTESFLSSPFWVELLDPKETAPTPVKFEADDEEAFLSHLQRSMTLSWILIDPTRKRAANLSSLRPVMVRRHWLTEVVQLRYATILGHVQCRIMVTCVGKEGGELQLSEVNLQVQDMEKKCLSGMGSLVILQEAMERGERKMGKVGEERERYEKYCEMMRERSKRKVRRERRVELVCRVIRVIIFLALIFLLANFIMLSCESR